MKLRAAKSSGARNGNDAKNCQSCRSSKGQEHLGKLHMPEARDDEQHHLHANRVDSHGRGRTSPSHTRDQHRSKIQGRGDERCEVTSPTDYSHLYSEHLQGDFV